MDKDQEKELGQFLQSVHLSHNISGGCSSSKDPTADP